jgi:hypothetical protein
MRYDTLPRQPTKLAELRIKLERTGQRAEKTVDSIVDTAVCASPQKTASKKQGLN